MYEIPGVILQPGGHVPLTRYGVSRAILYTKKVSQMDINRIYRSLFVYTVGFYELLAQCLKESTEKYQLQSRIWKVFAIL